MRTKFFKNDVIEEKKRKKRKGRGKKVKPLPRSPSFDASDLYQKYKDFKWTAEFPLERICISRFGLRMCTDGESF